VREIAAVAAPDPSTDAAPARPRDRRDRPVSL
jgi:hypothetical protein